MSEPLRVFVSHASQDKPFADALVRALRAAGADVWYDEHNLGAGHLLEAITKELAARKVFVVVLSKAAFASPWVRRECTWAFTLSTREPDRILLPVVAAPLDRSDFNALLFLEDFRRIEGPGDTPFPPEEAIERTVRLLGLTPPGQAATPQTPQPSESVEDLLTHGRAKLAEQAYAEALLFFERATQLAPSNMSAWFNRAAALGSLTRWPEALAAFEEAQALDPKYVEIWNGKGLVLRNLQRYEEALATFEQALALKPDAASTWYNKGLVLEDRQRYEEALAAFEQALALDPNDAVAWHSKGITLYHLQRYEEALAAFEQALALNHQFPYAWGGKGITLYRVQRYEEALAAFDHVLTLDPKNAIAWKMKSAALCGLGRTAEAAEAERRAKELGG